MTLLDGREIVRVKAIDRVTGRVVGATFDGQTQVDEAALRAQVAGQWRAAHGALMPDLVGKLAALGPADKLDVALWLKANVQPLAKAAHINSEAAMGNSAAGGAQSQIAGPTQPAVAASPSMGDGDKPAAVPLDISQVPAEVQARAFLSLAGQPTPAGSDPAAGVAAGPETPLSAADKAAREPGLQTVPVAPEAAAALAQAEAFKAANDRAIGAQIAPVRAHFMDLLATRGLAGQVQYASENTPVVYLSGVTRQQVEELASLGEVDAIYDARNVGGAALSTARRSQNADLLELAGGYTGSGVNVAVVEGERMIGSNPYLAVTAVRDPSRVVKPHPSAVGGMLRSTHATVRGLATGVNLYNSNGDDYTTAAALATAMDWGSANARVLNNSFYVEDEGTTDAPRLFDRHMDYIVRYNYDLAVAAAGNFGAAGCQYDGSAARNYVSTPGKGYNVLTVGNYDDVNTLGWTGDAMDGCSSYNHFGRYKPEVAAVGVDLLSTTTTSPWTGSVGSGTSYAAPMVTALAADLIQADSNLVGMPEALRAIIMATAEHNIEGDARLSRQDGAGGIDASAAGVVVERGDWDDRSIGSTTTFPITFSVFAWKGERVRFVTNWLSNPTGDYTSDPEPVDLDLAAYRSDGTTLVANSASGVNPFEIVDFVAPASEAYRIRVTFFTGTWTGNTWLGSAWWRGPWRSPPNVGFQDPTPKPLGNHLAYYPADHLPAIPTNYWRVMGIRSPAGTDNDLYLDSASWFADPATRSLLNSSWSPSAVDFVAVDGNHRTTPEFYHINKFTGTGSYNTTYSTPAIALSAPGWYGPYSMAAAETVKVFDVSFGNNASRTLLVIPNAGNLADLGTALMKSTGSDSTTWTRHAARESPGVIPPRHPGRWRR